MDSRGILDKEFAAQAFDDGQPYQEMLVKYKDLAYSYAVMENAIAVLSDLRTRTSHIYYGGFSRMLACGSGRDNILVPSIWEEEIFSLIHPDDLAEKHLQELCFFHFIRRQPKKNRNDYCLASKLRMKAPSGDYIEAFHRMFYISAPAATDTYPDFADRAGTRVPGQHEDKLWLALCLYSPLIFDFPSKCMIINSVNGQTRDLTQQNASKILSAREKQVLNLIDRGLTSKSIAEALCISKNTVSRHRQEILAKLQAKNSIEACRIAKELKMI